jgi:general stress protein 26
MALAFPSEDTAKHAVKVWSLVKSIKVGMMTFDETAEVPGGQADELNSRPMRALFEEHADAIWFIVPRKFLSSHSLLNGIHSALLTFSGGAEGDHVALRGQVTAVDDRAKLKALWTGHADIAFPKGPSDTDATLLRFTPEQAAFWAGGSDVLSFIVNFLEAKLTGNPPVVGEHAVVTPPAVQA